MLEKKMLVEPVGIEIALSSALKALRNILRNRKKQLSSVGNAYCCPKAAAFFSSRLPHRQQHFYYSTVSFPHRLVPIEEGPPEPCPGRWCIV